MHVPAVGTFCMHKRKRRRCFLWDSFFQAGWSERGKKGTQAMQRARKERHASHVVSIKLVHQISLILPQRKKITSVPVLNCLVQPVGKTKYPLLPECDHHSESHLANFRLHLSSSIGCARLFKTLSSTSLRPWLLTRQPPMQRHHNSLCGQL